MEEGNLNFVPTRCSSLKSSAVMYQEVVYKDPSKKKTKHKNNSKPPVTHTKNTDSSSKSSVNNNEIDLKRTRYEIKKFALSNVKLSNRENTLKQLAIELGARPPPNKAINYKDLLKEKQKEKEELTRVEQMRKLGQMSNKNSTNRKTNKSNGIRKRKSNILDIYGKAKIPAKGRT